VAKTFEPWFEIDREGWQKLNARRVKGRLILELVQNALDESGTTKVDIQLKHKLGVGHLKVTDDNPSGFQDLSEAWRLFAPSKKRTDPTKRGFMNVGEKQVLSICTTASIASTTGTVLFTKQGRRQTRQRTETGSCFEGAIRMTKDEYEQALKVIRTLIVPPGLIVVLNDEELPTRIPIVTFEATLPTQIADSEGIMRSSRRSTEVRVYQPLPGEDPGLYEMGLPVVETFDKYHVDIQQKVPLNSDRDNVTPGYLKKVRVAVLNNTHHLLMDEEATDNWVRAAAEDQDCTPEAITTVVSKRFGDGAVIFDPSDQEANKIAASEGRHVIGGRACSKGEFANIKKAGAALPAGQVTPSNPIDGIEPLNEVEWTAGIEQVVSYTKALARKLLGFEIEVVVHNNPKIMRDGAYGQRRLSFNVAHLGKQWFEKGITPEVDELVIHELAHEYASDHLSRSYNDACCRLAAKIKRLALDKPEFFAPFEAAQLTVG